MEKWAVGAAVAVGLLLGSGTLHAHGDEVHPEVPKAANGGQVQRARHRLHDFFLNRLTNFCPPCSTISLPPSRRPWPPRSCS